MEIRAETSCAVWNLVSQVSLALCSLRANYKMFKLLSYTYVLGRENGKKLKANKQI